MRGETEHFITEMFRRDLPLRQLIDSDWTMLNERLARHYGIADVLGPEFRRVSLDKTKTVRGGLLTQASIHAVTSNGSTTSPVARGVWVLEKFLGTPAPPPPPEVPAIEPDIRQRFEAHRDKPACYSCHIRLDPPGFALERFDAVGRWRDTDGGQPVDARGEWGGDAFEGPAQFKRTLMKNPGEFTRGFIEHLLAYALGRKLELFDMPAIADIQSATEADGHRLSRLIVEITKSHPSRHVRNLTHQ